MWVFKWIWPYSLICSLITLEEESNACTLLRSSVYCSVCENPHLFLAWELIQLSCTVKLATSPYHYARQISPRTQCHSPPMIHQRQKRHLQPCIEVILKLFLATRSKKNKRRNSNDLYEHLIGFDTIISLEVVRTSQFFWPDKPTFQELHWKNWAASASNSVDVDQTRWNYDALYHWQAQAIHLTSTMIWLMLTYHPVQKSAGCFQ